MRTAARREGVLRRREGSRSRVRTTALRAAIVLGLVDVLAGCGGGGTRGATTGAVALRAIWEPSSHVRVAPRGVPTSPSTQPVPPSVSTVEVRVNASNGQVVRTFVDPSQTRDVVIQNVLAGPATVQVFGYDLAFADSSVLNEFNLPPSYESAPVAVVIPAGGTADAGTVELQAQPFVTDFNPGLGASDVPRSTAVSFLVATAVGDIQQTSIDVSVAGSAVVTNGETAPGASLLPCSDNGEMPCGTGANRMLNGFIFQFATSTPYPPDSTVQVVVSAGDTNTPQRSFQDFQYFFTTGQLVTTPTPTATATLAATATATLTNTASATNTPSATSTTTPPPTFTSTPSATRTSTPGVSPTPTPTGSATRTPTSTPTSTATPPFATYVVTTTADDGPGSLRQALLDANTDLQPSLIVFDPALKGETISVTSDNLPAVEDSDTTINGDIDGDGRPDIQIDGPGLDFGFDVFAPRTTINGVSISSFDVGILLEVESANALIEHCYLGVALDGSSDAHNFDSGIEVHGTAHHVTNSVISANLGFGFDIAEDADGLIVTGNTVGATADRTASLGNGDDGVAITDSGGHVVGGTGPNDGNFIVSNAGSGISALGVSGHARNVKIQGNQIGDPNLRGNVEGVNVTDAQDVLIGGSEPGAGNVIVANDGPGIDRRGRSPNPFTGQ